MEIDSLSCPFSHRLEAIKKLRAYLKSYKPDYLVNIAVQMIQISSLSTLGLSVRTITWEHFSMAAASGFGGKLQRLFASIASKKLIVLTNQDRKAYPFFLRSKILVIPNFTNLNRTNELSYLNNKVVLSVGRFHNHHKGFDQLLEVWNTVHKSFPDWSLRIVGDGPDKQVLLNKIKSYALRDSVCLVPSTKSIQDEYKAASIYVLPSRYEAFGLVLIEAKSFGLPLVSFDCPYGPREIVRDGLDGFLVKDRDVDSMSHSIICLIADKNLREKMGSSAFEDYRIRWSEKSCIDKWKHFLG